MLVLIKDRAKDGFHHQTLTQEENQFDTGGSITSRQNIGYCIASQFRKLHEEECNKEVIRG